MLATIMYLKEQCQINMRKKTRLPPTHIRGSSFLSKEVGIYNGRGPFISRKKSITALRTKPTTLIKGMHLDQSKKKG